MKKLLLLTLLAMWFHTGRLYPIFTGNTGIQMLMCEYSRGPSTPNIWLQFENFCPGTVDY